MIRRPSYYVVLIVWGLTHAQAEAGPKTKSVYPFQLPPARAFDVLEDLNKVEGGKVAISKDERTLFANIKDGKPPNHTFAEIALLASGVIDAAKRQKYLKQIDELEAAARKAIAGARTTKEKGARLRLTNLPYWCFGHLFGGLWHSTENRPRIPQSAWPPADPPVRALISTDC